MWYNPVLSLFILMLSSSPKLSLIWPVEVLCPFELAPPFQGFCPKKVLQALILFFVCIALESAFFVFLQEVLSATKDR